MQVLSWLIEQKRLRAVAHSNAREILARPTGIPELVSTFPGVQESAGLIMFDFDDYKISSCCPQGLLKFRASNCASGSRGKGLYQSLLWAPQSSSRSRATEQYRHYSRCRQPKVLQLMSPKSCTAHYPELRPSCGRECRVHKERPRAGMRPSHRALICGPLIKPTASPRRPSRKNSFCVLNRDNRLLGFRDGLPSFIGVNEEYTQNRCWLPRLESRGPQKSV